MEGYGRVLAASFVLWILRLRWVTDVKRKIARLVALFALLAALPALALAADFAVVKGGQLNLRAQPNTSSKSLGRYSTGSWVRVDGYANGGWYLVHTMDGKTGYMSQGYLDFGAGTNTSTVRYANGGYVNLRSGPSMDAGVIMRVTCGTQVVVQSSAGDWDYISLSVNGSTVYGYMLRSFLESATTSAVVTTRNGGKVNVRSGPSSSYGSIGTLASGTRVTVMLKGNDWYRITANGMTGFMSSSYLSATGSSSGSSSGGSSSGGTPTTQTAYVNNPKSTQVLNLRERPSQNARSIGQYRNGTQVRVVAYDVRWCEVYVGTKHGYMMTRYLSFSYVPPVDQGAPPAPPAQSPPSWPANPTPTPLPQAPMITTVPDIQTLPLYPPTDNSQQTQTNPSAGTSATLVVGVGEANAINVYNDAAMTSLKMTVSSNTAVMLLSYDENVSMILYDGGVCYVLSRYIQF